MTNGRLHAALMAGASFIVGVAFAASALPQSRTVLHYASNGNFDANGRYLPGQVGFNVADVSGAGQLDYLPAGVKGLAWVGQCDGVDSAFLDTVRPYIGKRNLLGFYLIDDPDPTGWWRRVCTATNLMAESDWIHANVSGALTFILLMNMGRSKSPSFAGTYNPANSHVDLFGIDPYPCRTELDECDYDMIDNYVTAAESSGIPRSRMVPVYQAFGGGYWVDDGGGRYALPTASQERKILARWGTLVPAPVFDYAYSWGSQKADDALESATDLQAVFSLKNGATRP
jgi:hypothetical protein